MIRPRSVEVRLAAAHAYTARTSRAGMHHVGLLGNGVGTHDANPTASDPASGAIGLEFLRRFAMRTATLTLVCFGLLASLGIDARAAFIVNGGFETPVATSPFSTFAVGSTAITGWTVISGVNDPGLGSVDLTNGVFPAHSGLQAIDLDGTGVPAAGGLSQNVSGLTVGSLYTLDFFYANNPAGTSSSALVTIGSLSQTITHSGSTLAAMNYTEATFVFTATNSLLSFTSLDPAGDFTGIALDDVSIVAAPSPSQQQRSRSDREPSQPWPTVGTPDEGNSGDRGHWGRETFSSERHRQSTRTGIAEAPEASARTSIKARVGPIQGDAARFGGGIRYGKRQDRAASPFSASAAVGSCQDCFACPF